MVQVRAAVAAMAAGVCMATQVDAAALRFYVYNETAATDFTGLYVAPAGTGRFGANQALNDPDKALNTTERLRLTGLTPGRYDIKLVDRAGRTCLMPGVDLRQETSFEIRDADLAHCS